MQEQQADRPKNRSYFMLRVCALSLCLPLFLISCPNFGSAQTTMEELAGTRERLAMACVGMIYAGVPPNNTQGGSEINRHIIDVLNNNLDLARNGETNTQFLMRLLDFHAQRAGFVSGARQPQNVLDGAHRSGFLLSQLSTSGNHSGLRRIAEACIMTFRGAQ